jgi:hypothetical protein
VETGPGVTGCVRRELPAPRDRRRGAAGATPNAPILPLPGGAPPEPEGAKPRAPGAVAGVVAIRSRELPRARPVAGADVFLLPAAFRQTETDAAEPAAAAARLDAEVPPQALYRAVTDDDGRYFVTDVPVGKYWVGIRVVPRPSRRATAEGEEPVAAWHFALVVVRADSATTLDHTFDQQTA